MIDNSRADRPCPSGQGGNNFLGSKKIKKHLDRLGCITFARFRSPKSHALITEFSHLTLAILD